MRTIASSILVATAALAACADGEPTTATGTATAASSTTYEAPSCPG